ncbi:hypothetical protein, partial [Escherichia coli]|uniref:hypothetical protein n=1 Tax=Escherichia coli TaxID=562 RepID=UPI001BC84A30
MALKKYSTPSTFYAFAASCNACRMRRERLIRPTVLPLRRPDKTRHELNPKTWTVSVNRLFDAQ